MSCDKCKSLQEEYDKLKNEFEESKGSIFKNLM